MTFETSDLSAFNIVDTSIFLGSSIILSSYQSSPEIHVDFGVLIAQVNMDLS